MIVYRPPSAEPDAAIKALNARDALTEYKTEMERPSVQLKVKPAAEQIFNARFLPPLKERLPK